jgi:hypothetical protein
MLSFVPRLAMHRPVSVCEGGVEASLSTAIAPRRAQLVQEENIGEL